MVLQAVGIRSFEIGLYFRDGEFRGLSVRHALVLRPVRQGRGRGRLPAAPFLAHEKLDLIVKSGELKGHAEVLDLKDDERAFVWVDGVSRGSSGRAVCILDGSARGACRDGRCSPVAVRARRPEGHRRNPSAREQLEMGCGRPRLRGSAVPRRPLHRHARAGSVGVLEGAPPMCA